MSPRVPSSSVPLAHRPRRLPVARAGLWGLFGLLVLGGAALLLPGRGAGDAPSPVDEPVSAQAHPVAALLEDRDRWETALEPRTTAGADAAFLGADEEVFGVLVGDRARAYPLTRIALRHAVNDTIAGVPVLVTYCILCSGAAAFDPRVDGERLTFGLHGSWRGTATLYDHRTNSTWLQVTGACIAGAHEGAVLQPLPTGRLTTWGEWRTTHPDTDVMGGAGPDEDLHFAVQTVQRGTPFLPPPIRATVDLADRRLRPNALLYGIVVGGEARAYPFSALTVQRVVEERLGDTEVSVWFDPTLRSAAAYERASGGRLLSFAYAGPGRLRDRETGSRWTLDGRCVEGALAGTVLERVHGLSCEWYAWRAFHGDTTIWSP